MSDIPNPLGAFDIFNSRFEGKPKKKTKGKNKAHAIKKLFSKKIAKKLFGKKFATQTRTELHIQTPGTLEKATAKPKRPAFQISWASNAS